MKFNAVNTIEGLVPANDNDYEIKKKLKLGEVYEVRIQLFRNYKFHKKYFAMIRCAFEFLDEKQTEFFRNDIEYFRQTMELNAGHVFKLYSITRKEEIEQVKSIAFDKMSESDFQELYEKVLNAILATALRSVNKEEFVEALIYF